MRCYGTLSNESSEAWSVSIRRACAAIRFDPKIYGYTSRRPGQAALEKRMREICETCMRFGYRRVHVLLLLESWNLNAQRIHRVYREMGMQLRKKTLREDRTAAFRPNEVLAMDFVHDQLPTG